MAKANGTTNDEKKAPTVIARDRARLAPAVRNVWEILLPTGSTHETLLDPLALGPLARDLSPRDLVYAQANDQWLALYRVVSVTAGQVQLALLNRWDLPRPLEEDGADPRGFKIARNSELGWHAIRLSDNHLFACERDKPHLTNRERVRREILDHATVRQVR